MATVNVQWAMSKKAALEVFAQTGKRPDILRLKSVDLESLSVEQRRVFLAKAYNPGTDKLSDIDARGQKSGSTMYPPDLSKKDYPVEFDTEPTVEQVVEAIQQLAAMDTERKATIERKQEEDRARLQKSRDDEGKVLADLRSIEGDTDLQAALANAKAYALPNNDSRLISYKDGAIRTIQNKIEDAEKERWVQAHGSDHLKRACAGGYDCDRMYVVERAALEAPGWIVDYNGTGREKSRACPSMEALDIEEASVALAQQIGVRTMRALSVVWLTDEPTNKSKRRDEDWDGEIFEECEAVLLKGYLGEYDLYRIV